MKNVPSLFRNPAEACPKKALLYIGIAFMATLTHHKASNNASIKHDADKVNKENMLHKQM